MPYHACMCVRHGPHASQAEFFRDIIGDDFGQLKELLKGIARTVAQIRTPVQVLSHAKQLNITGLWVQR